MKTKKKTKRKKKKQNQTKRKKKKKANSSVHANLKNSIVKSPIFERQNSVFEKNSGILIIWYVLIPAVP